MRPRVIASAQPARGPATANPHDFMKKILLSVSLLAFAAACGGDGDPTSPTATVGPEIRGPSFDNISNTVDATIDAAAEVMSFNVGDAAKTTTLIVQPTNGDGKNGCNLTGSTTLIVSVASSNPGVATVSPASVTFTSCGATPTLTVTPGVAGSAIISLTQTTNNTGGSFDLGPASFTVDVAPAPTTNTAPSVAVAGVTDGASYNKGSVPVAMCQVTDAEDGNSSFPATLSAITGPNAADGIGSQTASCSYTDGGGLTDSESATYTIIDPSPPTIVPIVNPALPDGNNGWYKGNVTLTWIVSDPESPNSVVKTGCVDQNITADQGATTYACSATSAGGSTGPVSVEIKRDATAPSISGSRLPAPNSNGWNNTDVAVSFTCSDATSLVASCGPNQTLSGEGAGQSVTGNAADNAGNTNSATVTDINIDKTAPSVSLVGGPAAGGSYYFGSVPAAPTCSASDQPALSGLDGSCVISGYETTVGTHTVTATATDKAGNTNTASATYTVLAWTLTGFYQPVDMNGVLNIVKAGSTVPLKFEVFAGPTELTTTAAVQKFSALQTACDEAATTDDLEISNTGGTSLRYDVTGGQFIQNWQTPKLPGTCYRVTIFTLDGSNISALFKLK